MSRTIVVTGCSTGFGRLLAEQLARKGDRVYATMRGVQGKNAEAARTLREQAAGAALRVLEMDVASDASVEAAAAAILAESGAPDAVINNAGQMFVGIAEAFTPAELAEQLDVNVVGVHRVNRAFLPAMRQRGKGLIMNISSIAGRLAVPFHAIYHASKWGLEGYSIALRGELASSGIDVVVVEPGPFTTDLFPGMRLPADSEIRAASYPQAVHDTFTGMSGIFQQLFSSPDVPTDPQMVVDAMIELLGMTPGARPFRTVVGVDFGVRARNAAVEPHDAGVLDAAGLTAFATLRAGD